MTTPLEARTVPDIVTELPGPKARAHIEFDHAWTSPSLPRAYPIVPVRGLGCAVEDIDGNVFLDFAAGIAVNSTGHSHPDVVAAIQRAGRPAPALQRERLLPADLRGGRRRAGPDRADVAGAGVHRQLRGRGGRGRAQARPARHQAVERDRLPRRLPRPDDGRRQPDRLEGQVPRALRPAAARRLPRAVRQRGPRRARAPRVQAPDARRRVRRRHRRADPGRGRLRRPRGRLPGPPARAVRPPRDPADRRRGPVGRGSHRQDVGRPALGRRAGRPADGEGHRVGDAGRAR